MDTRRTVQAVISVTAKAQVRVRNSVDINRFHYISSTFVRISYNFLLGVYKFTKFTNFGFLNYRQIFLEFNIKGWVGFFFRVCLIISIKFFLIHFFFKSDLSS